MALVKVGAAWLREGKKGKFLSVKITMQDGDHNFLMFTNKHRDEAGKKPYYEVFVTADDEGEEPAQQRQAAIPASDPDDSVPF